MLIFQGVSKISHMIYNQVLYIQTVVFSPDFFQQFVSPNIILDILMPFCCIAIIIFEYRLSKIETFISMTKVYSLAEKKTTLFSR